MSERKEDSRLKELYEMGAEVYSYSKLNTINDCPYSAYLTYIKKEKGIHNIYDVCGSCVHDKLEKIMNGEANESDIYPELAEILEEMEMVGITFPKDFKGGDAIKDKWIANMTLFCRDFKKPNGTFKTEQLLILDLGNNRYLQGYSDLIRIVDDNTVQVFDWKTSSNFRTEDLLHHGRQLVAYSMALESEGYKVLDPAWIMLKYVEVSWQGLMKSSAKNSKVTKICDRCKLGYTIKSVVRDKMKYAGYDNSYIDKCIEELCSTNSIKYLPDQIQSKFSVKPYVRYYPLNDSVKSECVEYINRVADNFKEMKEKDYWPGIKIDKTNEFKCMNLCGYRNICPYLKKYLNQK